MVTQMTIGIIFSKMLPSKLILQEKIFLGVSLIGNIAALPDEVTYFTDYNKGNSNNSVSAGT